MSWNGFLISKHQFGYKENKSIDINYPLDDGRFFFFKMAAVFFEMYKMSVLGIKECIN